MRVSSGEVINVRKKHLTLLSDDAELPDKPVEPGEPDELGEHVEPDEQVEPVEPGEPGEQGGELGQTVPHATPSEGTAPLEKGFCTPGGGMGGVASDAQEQLVGDEVDGDAGAKGVETMGEEEGNEEGEADGEETTGSKGPKACAKQRKQPMEVPPPLTREQALEHVQTEGLTLRPGDNQSGYWNVSVLKHEDGRIRNEPYQAQVSLPRSIDHSAVRPLSGNRVHLGLFATAEEAALYVARSMEAGVAILKPEGVAHLAAQPAIRVRSAAATLTAARGIVKAVAVTAEDMEAGPPPEEMEEEEMEVADSAVAMVSYEDRPSQLEGYELLLSEIKSGYANVYEGTNPNQRCRPWLAKLGSRLLGSFEKPEQAALAVAKERVKGAREEKEEAVDKARSAAARATATLSATMVGRKELGAVQLLGLNLTAVSFEMVVDGERKTTEQYSMERRLQAQQMLREARRPQQRGLMPHHFGGPMQWPNHGELHPQLRNFAAPPAMTKLRVTVPPNSAGGDHVRVMTPVGLQMVQIPAGLQQGEQFDMVCHAAPQEVQSQEMLMAAAPRRPGRPPHQGGGIDLVLFNQQRRFGFSPASATLLPPLAPPPPEAVQIDGYLGNYKQPSTNPYIEFARSRRALLPPSMPNAEREALLGRMWKALPLTERVKFTAGAGASVEGDEEMDEFDADEEEEEQSELEEPEEEEGEGEVEDAEEAEEKEAEEDGMEIEYPRVRLVWRGKPEVSSVDKAMVGRRIKLYWPGEDAWFSGEVGEVFNIGAVTIAKVLYDDGEEQSHHLGIWEHQWLTDEWGNAEVQTTSKPGTASAWEGLVPVKYNQQQQPTEAPVDASLIDEKLWEGAAAAGWSLKAKGGGHYIYFAPDGRRFSSKKGAEEVAEEYEAELQDDETPQVDDKLWDGAEAAGWSIKRRGETHYNYFCPEGVKYTSKQAALDAAGLEEVDADEEEQEEQEEQGGEENLVDAKLWEGAASEGWSLKCNTGSHYVYYSPDGRRFSSKKAAEEVRHAVNRKRGREASDHGKGAKRAKGAKSEASRKAPADAQKWLTEGCQAEVQMQDGGMVGSRYPVRVMQLSSEGGTRRAEVLFDGLYAEVDGKADADDGAGADAKADADDGAGADAKANIDADFSPELIDEKLWEGAAAAGWRLRQRGGKSKYHYISPTGERFSSKRGAEDAAGIERVKPKALSVEEIVQEAIRHATGGGDEPSQAAPAAAKATPAAAKATPAAVEESVPTLDDAGAKALVGQTIEVYWDGELRWYAAKVLGYDKSERTHTVVYVVDEMESSEALRDGGITWRPAAPGAVEAERAAAGAEDDSAAASSRTDRLLEWVDAAFLVPAPPERPIQASSFETIALGARLELFYEGGWWPVTVLEKKPADTQLASGPSLHVQAIGYDVKSWAGLSAFRLPSAA